MLPLSLLLVLATSSTILASIPPDPFAHPKYALSFLNDLPIEHSQAQRWIKNGLPASDAAKGGVDVFFGDSKEVPIDARTGGERIGIDESEREEVEKLVGGGEGTVDDHLLHQSLSEDGLEQAILSAPVSDVEEHNKPSDKPMTSNYTLQHLLLPPGPRSYLCLLPPPPPPLSELPPPPPVPPMDPSLPEKLLGHLGAGCLYAKQGWFTYAYCHGKEVRQFRETARPWPPPAGGYVPMIDANYDDYVLGRAAADLNADQNLPPISLARGAGQRYLVQRWAGGTLCDKTSRGREIEVQFHCSMTGTDGIGLIKEVSTCSYILIINTPRLCNIPGFSSTHLSEPPSGISCREIVPDGSIPVPKLEDGSGEQTSSRTSKNRNPLPSWASLPPPSSSKPHHNPLTYQQALRPKSPGQPIAKFDDSESVSSLLQRVLAHLDASGALLKDVDGVSLGPGRVGQDDDDATMAFLKIERDEATGEVRVVQGDGSDSALGSLLVGGNAAPADDAAGKGDFSTRQSLHDWLDRLKLAQEEEDDLELRDLKDDEAYEREMVRLRKEAEEMEDEGEREEVMEALRRMEEEDRMEEERALRVLEERVKRRREVREGQGV